MNNTQLIPAMPTNMAEIAMQFAGSGYFTDVKDAKQAFVKIMAGAELGIPPFAAMSGIHVISGKPVLGAGLIASIIKRSGKYTYRVTEQSTTRCCIDFYEVAELLGTSTFTIEDARKAGTKNLDKYPANMLFSRAISNGAKWFTPDVFGGAVYAEGEITPNNVEETTAVIVQPARMTKREVADSMRDSVALSPVSGESEQTYNDVRDSWIELIEGCTTPDCFNTAGAKIKAADMPKSLKKGLMQAMLDHANTCGISCISGFFQNVDTETGEILNQSN